VSAPAAIAIRNLRVRRGGNLVLDDLSLELAAGSVTGLLQFLPAFIFPQFLL
jgi:hypothetical protein